MKILVKDENDRVLKISGKKVFWLGNTFKTAAGDSAHRIEDVCTLITTEGFFRKTKIYIPVALDITSLTIRMTEASNGGKNADMTDVSGSAVNTRIRQQLNITQKRNLTAN